MKHYGSMKELLSNVYPDHQWEEGRFKYASYEYWRKAGEEDDLASLTSLVEELATRFGIEVPFYADQHQSGGGEEELSNWYRVAKSKKLTVQDRNRLMQFGGLEACLRRVYPNHPWDSKKFHTPEKYRDQKLVLRGVTGLLPKSIGS